MQTCKQKTYLDTENYHTMFADTLMLRDKEYIRVEYDFLRFGPCHVFGLLLLCAVVPMAFLLSRLSLHMFHGCRVQLSREDVMLAMAF